MTLMCSNEMTVALYIHIYMYKNNIYKWFSWLCLHVKYIALITFNIHNIVGI